MLVNPARTHVALAKRPVSSNKEVSKEVVLIKIYNTGMWKACIRQALSDICDVRKRRERGSLSQRFEYQRLLLWFFVACNTVFIEEKEEIVKTQQKLLKMVKRVRN